MKCAGKIYGGIKTPDGKITFMCEVDGIGADEIFDNLMHEEKLEMSFVKWKEKRSLNANAYFWQLTDKIAKKCGFDRWTMYLVQLRKYGKFFDVSVINRAIPMLKQSYRYVEVLDEGQMNGEDASVVRCYIGSSNYNTEEMAELINGTVEDAQAWGIDTLPPDEIAHMISTWKGAFA